MLRRLTRAYLSLVFLQALFIATAFAQATASIRIRVIDGRSGQPLSHQRLLIFGGKAPEGARFHDTHFDIATNNEGVAELTVDPLETVVFSVFPDFKTPCYINTNVFSLKTIQTSGISAPDSCGKHSIVSRPGELIVFVRNPTLREKMAW